MVNQREQNNNNVWPGIITGLVLVCYFLLMKILNLNYILELHYFNFLFILFGIMYSLHRMKKSNGEIKYLAGLLAGVKTAFISAIIFNVFLLVYLSVIDPYFMEHIIKKAPLGNYMSPLAIAVVLFTEETGAGLIMTLIVLHFYKT